MPRYASDSLGPDRALRLARRAAAWGAADRDRLRATAALVPAADADRWVLEWLGTAGTAWADAHRAADAGDRAAAHRHHLHAATYYAVALASIGWSSDADRGDDVRRRQEVCWARALAYRDPPGDPLAVPYAGAALPGWFLPAPGATADEPRPTVLVLHDESTTSAAWALGGAGAAFRGYHWATLDAPGQRAALHAHGLVRRPDQDPPLTALLDTLIARPDVDPARLAAIAHGDAANGLLRALPAEHRLAAAVVAPAVRDPLAAWRARLPAAARERIDAGDWSGLERELRLSALRSPELGERIAAACATHGVRRAAELFASLSAYRIDAAVGGVATPLLEVDDVDSPADDSLDRRVLAWLGTRLT